MVRRIPHRRLSEPFDVLTLDLQARVDAVAASRAASPGDHGSVERCNSDARDRVPHWSAASGPAASRQRCGSSIGDSPAASPQWEHDAAVEVAVIADGLCNAVLVWYQAEFGGGPTLSSWHPGVNGRSGGGGGGCSGDEPEATAAASCERAEDPSCAAVCATSWSQGLQYLDGVKASKARGGVSYMQIRQSPAHCRLPLCQCCFGVQGLRRATPPLICNSQRHMCMLVPWQGEVVALRVCQDAGQLQFASDPPQRRPRHAYLPRWHFDMVRCSGCETAAAAQMTHNEKEHMPSCYHRQQRNARLLC